MSNPNWRKALPMSLYLVLILVLMVTGTGAAAGEGAPHQEVLGYPKTGCFDVATGGTGMWSGNSPYPLSLDVPGPVVDAYLVWLGTEDTGAPDSPAKSDLVVNGTTVIGDMVDQKQPGQTDALWYMWRADIGPGGANLVKQGANQFNLSGWGFVEPAAANRRNGASVVVVYSTGACTQANQVNLIDDMDWYWERGTNEETTDPLTFTFAPSSQDRIATVWLHHAGTDHTGEQPRGLQPNAPATVCRPENIWAARGSGNPPDRIVQWGNPSTGLSHGQLVVENAFVPSFCGITSTHFPVYEILGWVDGFGWSQGNPGFVAPEWSVIRLKLQVPAGSTWVVLQAESEFTGSPEVTMTGESGAWFGQFVLAANNPELRVAKTDGLTSTNPGDTLTYTISYENYGAVPAADVVLVDTLPVGVSYVSATNGGVFDAATRTVRWEVGTLGIGQTGSVSVVVKVDGVLPVGLTNLVNTVTITTSSPGDSNPSDNTATDETAVAAASVLKIDKKAAPEPVAAGENLTYTIDWEVGGTTFSEDVRIVDTLPAEVSVVNVSDGGSYNPVTHEITWLLGDVTPVETGTFTVVVKADAPVLNGTTFDNTVVITNKAGDTATDTVKSTVTSDHVLKIAKSAASGAVAGQELTYLLDWEVTGTEPGLAAKIVDTLPANVTFVSATNGGTYDAGTHKVTWSLGDVNPPSSGQVGVTVLVATPLPNGTDLLNTVVFSDETPGSDPVTDELLLKVSSDHDLSITKLDDPDPVEKGANITYAIAWSVLGDEPATGVKIVDSVPFGTQFVSASDGGVHDPATNTVTWAVGNKVPGDTGSMTMVVMVNLDFPNDLDVSNTAVISDDKPGEAKQATATTAVVATPDGALGDTVWNDLDRDGFQDAGEPGLSGVKLELYGAGGDGNCGTGDDTLLSVTTTDVNGRYLFGKLPVGTFCVKVDETTLPAGLTLTTPPNPAGPFTLAEGQTNLTVDFGYGPPPGTGAIGDTVYSDANGNGTQDPGEVGIGNVTLTLAAAGADAVCGTSDDNPMGATTTGASGKYLFSALNAGSYCVDVTDTHNALAGYTLTGGTDPAGPIVLTAGQSFLDADFGYQGPQGSAGDLVCYDINRDGMFDSATESGFANVTLSLMTAGPDSTLGTADDVAIASTTTDGNGNYSFSGIADGEYAVKVTDQNSVLAFFTQTFGVPNTNNNGQVNPFKITITGGNAVLYADFCYGDGHALDVTKVNNIPDGQLVQAGGVMTYTLGYEVLGRASAPDVVLKDTLPADLEFVSASNGGVYVEATRTVTWNLGTLAAGTKSTVTVTVRVKKPLPDNTIVTNCALLTDSSGVIDEACDTQQVNADPVLELTKVATPPGEVKPGDTIAYRMCYKNTGNGIATGVTLTDVIPLNTSYVIGTATGAPVYNEGTKTLTWAVGTLNLEQGACVDFSVKVNMIIIGQGGALSFSEWLASSIINTAVLASDQVPDVTATVSNPLNAVVNPQIFKSVNKSVVREGEAVEFTVTLTNNGTATASNVVVSDQIHPRLSGVTLTTTKGSASYDPATRVWTVVVGTLAPSETVMIFVKGSAADVAAEELPYTITNRAQVQYTEGTPRDSNEVVVQVVAPPPLGIPEPGTWLMLGSGLAGLAGYARMRVSRRRKNG